MAGVCRVGLDIFGAGVVLGAGSVTTRIDGAPASLVGDLIAPHGEPPHSAGVIANGSSTVLIDGRPVAAQAISIATCGHPASSGSVTTFVGI